MSSKAPMAHFAVAIVVGACAALACSTFVTRDMFYGSLRENWATAPLAEHTLDIVQAYERVLDRRPTPAELASVVKRLKTDPTFSLEILEVMLVMSRERRRAMATQTNALRTELEGVATRGQVIMHVRNVYMDVVGREPSSDTQKFLVSRYMDSGMDEHELMRLVTAVSIVPLAGNAFALGAPSTGARTEGPDAANASAHATLA